MKNPSQPHPEGPLRSTLRLGVRTVLGAVVLLGGCGDGSEAGHSDTAGPEQEDERITAIERSILPSVRVEGREVPPPVTLEERMQELEVAAVSAAVVRNGQVAWARAWGMADVEEGRPATPGTLFQAASISKPVAATGALLLVEAGTLELDGPVNDHLTSWRIPDHEWEAASPVTLRHLLTHTGGLSVHGFPGYQRDVPLPDLPGILDGIAPANTGPVRVTDEPGSLWRYSGGGTTIVQLVMADVTGEPFPSWMARRVLAPIGMTSSTYEQPLPDSLHLQAATAYRQDGGSPPGGWHVYPEQAAAGLWTTPTDLARWIIALQASLTSDVDASEGDPGTARPIPSGRGLLRPETARAMVTPGEGDWGLGPTISGTGSAMRFSHGGSNHGFKAQMTGWMEGGRGLVVMTNSDQGALLIQELALAIADEYGWEGYEPQVLVPLLLEADQLERYVGEFGSESGDLILSVTRENEALWLVTPDEARRELVPTAEQQFAVLETGQSITFQGGGGGRIDSMRAGGLQLDRLDPSAPDP